MNFILLFPPVTLLTYWHDSWSLKSGVLFSISIARCTDLIYGVITLVSVQVCHKLCHCRKNALVKNLPFQRLIVKDCPSISAKTAFFLRYLLSYLISLFVLPPPPHPLSNVFVQNICSVSCFPRVNIANSMQTLRPFFGMHYIYEILCLLSSFDRG